MVELLYQIFVYNNNTGEKSISFDRIKRLLSNNIEEFENYNLNYNYLFQLLKYGIIDKVEINKYSLSNTLLITNSKNNFSVGLNFPDELLKINNHLIKQQYLGLTVFDGNNINVTDYELNKMDFDFDKIISQLNSINSIVKNWNPDDENELGQITKLEKYNPLHCKYANVKDIKENNSLYKYFLHNGAYFKYLFFYKNKFFSIEPYEYEKVNTLKLINGNKSLFKYNAESSMLKLKNYYTYPTYLYKILLLNHAMNTGEIPINNQFKIEFKQFSKIIKTLNLNHTLE